ncbi:unnamed protein product [Adineta ricciae]|uniref:Uncharacterized protein n=1 Tax=Adineta ricciae TaxID=249248 RepID=A0A814H716_ADIRI|nr:unnamed protein product [Adineta ricciae]
MSSSPPPPSFPLSSTSNNKKPIRELSSITNHLLATKTLNALANNNNNNSVPPPPPSTSSIKENIPNDPNIIQQQKALNLRLAAALKPVERDNVAALLQLYQTLSNQSSNQPNLPSNGQTSSTVNENSSLGNNLSVLKQQNSAKRAISMTYLCRFNQRNRLIEVPSTSEFFNQQHGISHEHLKQLIIQEFQIPKLPLIIQIWSEQYQEYIDIESYKKIPLDGRIQVLIEKDLNSIGNSPSVVSKSPTTPMSTNAVTGMTRSITPIPLQSTPGDNLHEDELPTKCSYDDSMNTVSPMQQIDNLSHSHPGLMYDLLPKPSEGIPIPRFPPHIAAFLNGNGDANQLNALVQALYQEIVKYELYPNADELRSIVSRLVDRYPNSLAVIGSVELLVRKLYYKFCNERKKYPVELKRRQPNKRKRVPRDDDLSMSNISQGRNSNTMNDLDRLMHLWTGANDYKDANLQHQEHSPSGSSTGSSSPVSSHQSNTVKQEPMDECQKYHPLNLSVGNNNANVMCSE